MKTTTSQYMRIISILLIIALAFAIVGCSFGANSEMFSPEYIEQIVNPDRSLFYGETITVATSWPEVINRAAILYMDANPGVRIIVNSYYQTLTQGVLFGPFVERVLDSVRLEIATQLMAGSAPTLIEAILADPFDPRQAAFFYDWYLLMDADPDFVEDDWFMNVFHAFEVNDRFYHFPLYVEYQPIVANRSIPGLLEAFTIYSDGITLLQLMQLSYDFLESHPQYYLEEHFSSACIMRHYSDRFIDMETERISFDDDFINLITFADSITCPRFSDNWRAGSLLHWRQMRRQTEEQIKSERYLFHFDVNSWYYYWLDFEEDLHRFSGMTPLTNDRGELLVESVDNFVLNANATPIQKAIAWDFLIFAMQPENYIRSGFGMYASVQSASRSQLEPNVSFPMSIFFYYNYSNLRVEAFPWFLGDYDEAMEGVLERMMVFSEMPMRSTRTYPRIIDDIIEENLYLFYAGLLSAEQAAQNIQNQVTLVLMEMSR
ncbi:MAG: hypothetical protein FWD05_07425 [Oscillospiraceae bacterium]|nr:hypothetical protein [Oscillospiraceae bacterium]